MTAKETAAGQPPRCFLERFSVRVARIVLGGLFLFLAVLSAFVTCRVYGGAEVVEYQADAPLLHLVFLAAVLALGAWAPLRFRRSGRRSRMARERRYVRLLMAAAGFYLVWLLFMMIWGGSDSRYSMESARLLLEGDTSPWEPWPFQYGGGPAGYARTYPSQNGLILYMVPAAFFFGSAAPHVLQALNIGFFFLGVISIGQIFQGAQGQFRLQSQCVTVLMALFLPFSFYFLFVYGTMPGFGLSCLAMERAQRYVRTGKRSSLWIAAAAVTAASLIKSNYLIVLVGMILYLAGRGLFDRKLRTGLAAILLAAVWAVGSRGMNLGMTHLTGCPVSGGIPMTAWAEMGLQEGSRGPGWYNGYHVGVFLENGGDSERTKAAVREDLEESLRAFGEDPAMAADFFLRKTESIWAEPTFQSLWIQEVGGGSWLLPAFTDSLLKKGGLFNEIYVALANLCQTLVYAGAFLWMALGRRETDWETLLPGIVALGGFLFHLVWEAKGQYTVCYFILLIPLAYLGLEEAARRLRVVVLNRRPRESGREPRAAKRLPVLETGSRERASVNRSRQKKTAGSQKRQP